MDPNEALRLYRSALADNDAEEASEHAANLRRWISCGGFLPKGLTDTEKVALGIVVAGHQRLRALKEA